MTFAARTFQGAAQRGAIQYTFAANAADQSFDVTAGVAPSGGSVTGTYIGGNTTITIIVNSSVYIYSTSVATPALALTGGAGNDTITLTNNGFIMGCGGIGGGSLGSSSTYDPPNAGGIALQAGFALSVVKNAGSYIGGGGGGGGGDGGANNSGGGGAGGGASGSAYNSSGPTFVAGAVGGTVGNAGANGVWSSPVYATGGGGGRLFPGTGGAGGVCTGTVNFYDNGVGGTAGGGGSSRNYAQAFATGGGGGFGAAGGAGNGWTTTTGSGAFDVIGGAGGSAGSVGANGTETKGLTLSSTLAGAAGGKAINFNGFTVTISGSGTTYGATS